MSPEGATDDARALDAHLQSRKNGGAQSLPTQGQPMTAEQRQARVQMDREIAQIRLWLQTLDLHFDDTQSMQQKQEQIKQEIRTRLRRALLPR